MSRRRRPTEHSAGIREELDQPSLATEPLAGLIQVALESGDLSTAERWTEKILAHLEGGGTLDGTEEQLRIYLACYRTLEIKRDARSKVILQSAGKLLDAQVSKFRDDEARRRYVEKVPWRLAVQQAWEAARARSGLGGYFMPMGGSPTLSVALTLAFFPFLSVSTCCTGCTAPFK